MASFIERRLVGASLFALAALASVGWLVRANHNKTAACADSVVALDNAGSCEQASRTFEMAIALLVLALVLAAISIRRLRSNDEAA
jgi:hypothetical protein